MTRRFGTDKTGAADWLIPAFESYTDDYMVLAEAKHTRTAEITEVRDVNGILIPNSVKVHGWRDALEIVLRSRVTGTIPAADGDWHTASTTCSVDRIEIATAKGEKAAMTISGHMHRKTAGGNPESHQTVSGKHCSLPAFAGFGASTFGLSGLGVAPASLQRATYVLDFIHTDADDTEGNWLCGKTHGVKATATFEAIDETDWGTPDGWTRKEAGDEERNTAYARRRLTIEKVLF